jgi:hypothetical protein
VLKVTKLLRGGSWETVETVIFIGVIIFILSQGVGFVPNNLNPGWGLDRPNSFQPPGGNLRYPPIYDFFAERRTPGCPRPGLT